MKYIHMKNKKICLLYVNLMFMSFLKIFTIGNAVHAKSRKIQLNKINRKVDIRKMEKST